MRLRNLRTISRSKKNRRHSIRACQICLCRIWATI